MESQRVETRLDSSLVESSGLQWREAASKQPVFQRANLMAFFFPRFFSFERPAPGGRADVTWNWESKHRPEKNWAHPQLLLAAQGETAARFNGAMAHHQMKSNSDCVLDRPSERVRSRFFPPSHAEPAQSMFWKVNLAALVVDDIQSSGAPEVVTASSVLSVFVVVSRGSP